MNKKDVSKLTEAQSTLLMPLWARALEAQHPTPLILVGLRETMGETCLSMGTRDV